MIIFQNFEYCFEKSKSLGKSLYFHSNFLGIIFQLNFGENVPFKANKDEQEFFRAKIKGPPKNIALTKELKPW